MSNELMIKVYGYYHIADLFLAPNPYSDIIIIKIDYKLKIIHLPAFLDYVQAQNGFWKSTAESWLNNG